MKPGSENRKKTIAAGGLGAVALICILYAYNSLFGGSSAPSTPPPAPVAAPTRTAGPAAARAANVTVAGTPGVAATRMASTSSSLDPTLDDAAMLRTESLIYAGAGRNIFSATYTPPPPPIPKAAFSPRPAAAPVYVPPVPTGPPPPPPINLKFFGTAKRSSGGLQAFLLQGEDVYLAAQGDIVARKYKIGNINPTNIQVEDLQNNNTQTLNLQH